MSDPRQRYRRLLDAVGYSGALELAHSSERETELLSWIADAFAGALEEVQSEIALEQEELTLFATALEIGAVTSIPPFTNDFDLTPADLVIPGYLTPSQIRSTLERNALTTRRLQRVLETNDRRLGLIRHKSRKDHILAQQTTTRRNIDVDITVSSSHLVSLHTLIDNAVGLSQAAIDTVLDPALYKSTKSILDVSIASVDNLKALVELFPSPAPSSLSVNDIEELATLSAELEGSPLRQNTASGISIVPTSALDEEELHQMLEEELAREAGLVMSFEEAVTKRQAFVEHSVRSEIEAATREQSSAELEASRFSVSELKSFLQGEIAILSTLCGRLSTTHIATTELVVLLSALVYVLGTAPPTAPLVAQVESNLIIPDDMLLESLQSISKSPLLDRYDVRAAIKEVLRRFEEQTTTSHQRITSNIDTAKLYSATSRLYSPTSILHPTSTSIDALVSSAKAAEKNAKLQLASSASRASDLSPNDVAALSRLKELLKS